jgi:hypothetical protein
LFTTYRSRNGIAVADQHLSLASLRISPLPPLGTPSVTDSLRHACLASTAPYPRPRSSMPPCAGRRRRESLPESAGRGERVVSKPRSKRSSWTPHDGRVPPGVALGERSAEPWFRVRVGSERDDRSRIRCRSRLPSTPPSPRRRRSSMTRNLTHQRSTNMGVCIEKLACPRRDRPPPAKTLHS